MSQPKLISPLLDGYIMGEALTAHHGVCCCPALLGEEQNRHIVKIISIPASQDQLDALLLTGAFDNELRAKEYFKELAEGVCEEVRTLDKLSKLDGFVPFIGSQIEKMEDGVGYDVYLLAPYRPSLEENLYEQPLTHLAAVNLGLDMCAALSVCRKAGFLYADLKPKNIFKTETRGYCIGDLGFIPLSSLKYASLPEKYRSSYTAPEISDAYAALSDSLDIYALGLVLYQVYNNGELPFTGNAPDEPLPPPMYADYEMAEIILKACAPDPAQRWADPAQMGQALVDYMQRNSVNDTSIIPPPPEPLLPAEPEEVEFLTEEENDAELAELLAMIPDEEPPEEISEDVPEEESAEACESEPAEETAEEEPPVLPQIEVNEDGVTEEVADILAQADELMQIEPPEPVVVPEPIDIPIPPPFEFNFDEPEEESSSEETEPEEEMDTEEESEPEAETPTEDESEDELDSSDMPYPEEMEMRRKPHWLTIGVALLLVALLALSAHFFYQSWYLQPIDSMTIDGGKNSITVHVITKLDETKLTAVCTDTYGNTLRQPIVDGQAYFADLKPNTQYKIQLEIDGFHKLTGNTTDSHTTATQTKIVSFNATMGSENGMVHLNFVSDGPDSDSWLVEYTAKGSTPQTKPFVDKTVTLTGLLTNHEYTFRILSEDDLFITGESEMTYHVNTLILPQYLSIRSYSEGELSVEWADLMSTLHNWTVTCRSDTGVEQSLVTQYPTATFTDLDMSVGYTVTVTAEGMPRGESITIKPHPINVTEYVALSQAAWSTHLTWHYTGQTPSGWILSWEVDGVEQEELLCQTNMAIITVRPGSTYRFEARPADDSTYFTIPFTYEVTETETFEGFGITAADITVTTHHTPSEENWRARDLSDATKCSEFILGESACLLLESAAGYAVTDDMITTTFVLFDSENKLVSVTDDERTWDDMWSKRKCAVALPEMPAQAGEYSLDLYIAGQYVTTVEFTIV